MFSMLIFFLWIGLSTTDLTYSYDGSDCTLRNGSEGVCRALINCPSALKQLQEDFASRFKHVRCGFEGNNEIICCPKVEEESTTVLIKDKTSSDSTRVAARECESIKKRIPVSVETHIIQGEEASEGEFPHMAALGYMIENQLQFNCGGSLISDNFIVTAGHCIVNNYDVRPHLARMGTLRIDEVLDIKDTDYPIEENDIILHPTYTSRSKYNDIALIKLSTPVIFTLDKSPACLYLKNDEPTIPLTVCGWGFTDRANVMRSDVLLKTSLIALSQAQCIQEYSSYRRADLASGITEQQLCAADPNWDRDLDELKRDTCGGDSGGPIQLQENGHVSIVGITSFSSSQCGSGRPTVYTRISQYLDWIESEVWGPKQT